MTEDEMVRWHHMPLKCSASSPVWISSPMKARAHTSSFRNLVGEYEMLQSVKSIL